MEADARRTPWASIWMTSTMLLLVGVQYSIYFTSTWQYIKEVDPTATLDHFAFIMAITSIAGAMANPLFGYWNQKTMSTKHPVCLGFTFCAIGNLMYGLLPAFPANAVYVALVARFLCGFGSGTLGVLRSFLATASTKEDRIKAISIGTGGLTSGLALGPAVQICFLPIGNEGIYIGPVLFNMYTTTAFFMCLVNIVFIICIRLFLVEDYAGIISDESKKSDPFLIIPKFDKVAVAIMFFVWWILSGVSSTQGLAAPITMAMFNWTSEEAVLYNGIIQSIACMWSTTMYILFGTTRLGQIDKRYLLTAGLTLFLSFHLIHIPFPFYDGPLDRPQIINGTEMDLLGGCSYRYDWCETTTRVPLYLYLFAFSTIVGIGFPLISASCNSKLSEIIGPRKQGFVTGLMAFTGCMAQTMVPIIASRVYAISGFKWIMVYHVLSCSTALIVVIVFRKRIIPLNMKPDKAKYKSGTFYHL
ncbi:unnamed protein product [Auanema sp. JU1783]|nr:unnamed protein product [Auanema sp. JU1783]